MRRLLLSLAALRLAMATGQAKADYIFTTPLDPPDSRSTNMNGSGINASGLIVGDYLDADTRTHGYLLSGGATLHSTFPSRLLPEPLGSTTPGRSWEFTETLTVEATASCG